MKKITMLISAFMLFFVFTGCQPQEMDFGIENAYIVEQSEKVKLAENICGEVFLLAEDNNDESIQIEVHHLAVVLDDKVIVQKLSKNSILELYEGDITLSDFDGDGDVEILLQEEQGSTGGYGNYLSRVFDFKNGELVELFSSEDETGELFDTGFSITLLKNKEFEIKNAFTNYSEVFRREGEPEEYFEFWYDENGEPIPQTLFVDSFFEFVPKDVDGDGVSEIKGQQYTSLIGHTDCVGFANAVWKYNKEKGAFEIVTAYFSIEEEYTPTLEI